MGAGDPRFGDEDRLSEYLSLEDACTRVQTGPDSHARELIRVREGLNLSRALFAIYFRTNVRTLENWEQGRAEPNAQAAPLINLVKRYPDTVQRLASI